jgi:3-oxoacyl-[acyl-carrier-protein] synthase II
MSDRRVVITGLGMVSPLGASAAETWQGVVSGRGGVAPIARFDASTFPTQFAAEVKDFSVDPYVSNRATRRLLSRAASFGLAAAKMAWQDAGLAEVNRARVGVILGSCLTAPTPAESNAWCRIHDGGTPPEQAVEDPFAFLRRASHTGTALIASELGAEGPNASVYVACASGTQAIGMARQAVREGDADVMVTGGYDSMVSEWYILLFSAINALSRRNADPERASRPFDRDRDGFVMGEGAGVLVLEERLHALRRGAAIYAELLGYGSSLDAYRITDSPADGAGAARAMSRALANAGIGPEEVDYINAHGTSTPDNDRSETRAIKSVFGEASYRLAVSSTKSMTGHLISAAGGLEAGLTALALRDGIVPPTINLHEPDPECDLDYVPWQARAAPLQVALSNSFGFGGSNGSIVLRRADGPSAREKVVAL